MTFKYNNVSFKNDQQILKPIALGCLVPVKRGGDINHVEYITLFTIYISMKRVVEFHSVSGEIQ